MTTSSPVFLLAALGVLSTVGTASAQVDTSQWKCESCPFPKGTSGSVDAGVGSVSDASSKFGDYTGLQRDGAHLVLGGQVTHRSESGYFADLEATDLGVDVRSLSAQSGREGLYRLQLGYSEVPRHLTNGAASPYLGIGSSVLTLPAGFPAGDTASMPLSTTLRPIELGYKVQRFDLGGTLIAGERLTYSVSLRHDVRDGTQPRFGSFIDTASQLAAPVDHVTNQFEVSAAYVTRRLQATLAYQLSTFSNGAQSLTWDNPFLPVIAGATRGQLALAPDNKFQQIHGSAGYQITPRIRASASFAVGSMTQDEPYLSPTLNAGLATAVGALPASSLDGKVDTFSGSVNVTADVMAGLRVHATYDRDVRDNRTPIRSYPVVDTDMFIDPLPRSNTPFDIERDRVKLGADYRGPATLRLAGGIEYENLNRSYQEVVDTRETTLWGRASLRPRDNLSLSLKLAHAERDPSTYGVSIWFGPPQNTRLRKLNLAARQRDSVALRADLSVNDNVSVGLTADYTNDDYNETTVGVTEVRSSGLGADVAVALSEKTQVHAFAQGDRIRSRQAGSQAFTQPDWRAQQKDGSDVVGVGIKHVALADKLELVADLTSAKSRSDLEVGTGAAAPSFPRVKSTLDTFKLQATYQMRDDLSLVGSFWYERYSADDWRLDGVLPATVPNLLVFGEQAPHYRVNVLRIAARYRF